MSVILILIPLSILFAVAFLAAFVWAVRSGQYEDTCTPSMRVLADEPMSVGMRPSPGAESSGRPPSSNRSNAFVPSHVSAPGDGRTPLANPRRSSVMNIFPTNKKANNDEP